MIAALRRRGPAVREGECRREREFATEVIA